MTALRPDGGRDGQGSVRWDVLFDVEEFRRRNTGALAMDVLYLFTVAFFAALAARGFWPAVIAVLPIATFLYFGWRASIGFFLAQVGVVVATIAASYAGFLSG